MPESSVDSYINAQPEEAMSWSQFVASKGLGDSPDHWTAKVGDFFTGYWSKARNEYEAYLQNLKNRNEWLATQSARAYDKMMDDSKIQRQMKDFDAAGLNPYLIINSGGISPSSIPSSAKASYDFKRKEKERSDAGRNFALILLAAAKIAAALL